MFGTYQRLRVRVSASPREVIRASRKKLATKAKRDYAFREQRKAFYRAMLEYHCKAQRLANFVGGY